jgi:hypothetical protein
MSLKIQINSAKIKTFKPCKDRFDNWLEHYDGFNGDILEFLALDKITNKDKIWVSVRVLPGEQLEYFAIDSAFAATGYAAAYAAAATTYAAAAATTYADAAAAAATTYAAAAYAADAAAYAAADAAAYAAATYAAAAAAATATTYADAAAYAAAERSRQVDCLDYLIRNA